MRNTAHIRQHEILCMMLGRSITLSSLEELRQRYEVGIKTIKRDIEALISVPLYKISIKVYEGEKYYRSDAEFKSNRLKLLHRICKVCDIKKDIKDFYKDRNNVDGFQNICKRCRRQYDIDWRKKNKLYLRKYYKRYYQRKKRILAERALLYYRLNKEKINTKRRLRYTERKSIINAAN
ncbi:MAG: hypothetical protein AABY22_04900 [Nanoarchaeota archaeon]